MPIAIDAPIVAVTVYPQHARVTRRGRARLGTETRFAVEGLPPGLRRDSVRVNGSGPASIVGVDLAPEHRARSADPVVLDLRERRRTRQDMLREVTDARTAENAKAELLESLSRRSGRAFADALAQGKAGPDRVASVSDALSEQLSRVLTAQRELEQRQEDLTEELAAIDRELDAKQIAATPDRVTATIELEPAAEDAEIELELSYVVTDARWSSTYDVRLRGETVGVAWHAMVTQHTGEDWPECELALSTARPSVEVGVPELDPWFLDRVQPAPQAPAGPMRMGYGGTPETAAAVAPGQAMRHQAVEVEQGATAATYRPSKPVAVPSDGAAHRVRLTGLDLEAKLDHITAPVRGEEAYLRAVVTNTSGHTLRPGPASVFHGNDFVGTTRLDSWAPGEEVELALGVDDRVRVERELVRRGASKGTLSGTRKREAEYRIKIGNHTGRPATVTVLDQIPVSRDEAVSVRDIRTSPEPTERTELGELTWRLDLAADATAEITLAFRVDVGRGVELSGWRE